MFGVFGLNVGGAGGMFGMSGGCSGVFGGCLGCLGRCLGMFGDVWDVGAVASPGAARVQRACGAGRGRDSDCGCSCIEEALVGSWRGMSRFRGAAGAARGEAGKEQPATFRPCLRWGAVVVGRGCQTPRGGTLPPPPPSHEDTHTHTHTHTHTEPRAPARPAPRFCRKTSTSSELRALPHP